MSWHEITVRIPVSLDIALSPNGRAHWRKKHRIAKDVKTTTMWAVKSHYLDAIPETPWQMNYTVGLAKGRKRWDDDNLIAGLKYVRDGIAAELGIDDRHMVTGTVEQVRDKEGIGYVEVQIRGGAQ